MKAVTRPRLLPDPEFRQVLIRKSTGEKRLRYTGFRINDTTEELGVKSGEFANSVPTPTGFVATGSIDKATLRWDGVLHKGLTGYKLYRDGEVIQQLTGTSYEDFDVEEGETYIYWVTAIDIYGDESPDSDTDDATIGETHAAPTTLVATSGDQEVTLEWDAPDGQLTPDSYEISQDGTTVATVNHPTLTDDVTGLNNNTEYRFTVRAIYGSVKSDYSNAVLATPSIVGENWFVVGTIDDSILEVYDYDLNLLASLDVSGLSGFGNFEAISVNKDGYIVYNHGSGRGVVRYDSGAETLTEVWMGGGGFGRGSMNAIAPDDTWVHATTGNVEVDEVTRWQLASASKVAAFPSESGSGYGVINFGQRNGFTAATPNYWYVVAQDTALPDNAFLIQLDWDTTSILWKEELAPADTVYGSTLSDANRGGLAGLNDDTIIVGWETTLKKYDSDQNLIWDITLPASMSNVVADADGTFYVSFTDGRVRKYSAGSSSEDPVEEWVTRPADTTDFAGAARGVCIDGGDNVIIGSSSGWIARIAMSDGEVRGVLDHAKNIHRSIDVHPGSRAIL